MKLDTFSELELHVIKDMVKNGFNPQSPEDIKKYWAVRLGDETGG